MTDIEALPGQVDALEILAETPQHLPDLPGKVRGIVGMDQDERGHNVYTLQCERCLELETTDHLVLMRTKFHRRGNDPRRLCPTCRHALFPGCTCDGCRT